MKSDNRCRTAETHDLPALTEIYNQAVLGTTGTFDTEPKTVEERTEWLGRQGEREPVIVSFDEVRVTGWAWLHLWSLKRAYEGTGEVTLYVREEERGNGVGTILLRALLDRAVELRYRTVLARIESGNDASLSLHRKAGFDRVGVMREVGLKLDRLLDVHILQKRFEVE